MVVGRVKSISSAIVLLALAVGFVLPASAGQVPEHNRATPAPLAEARDDLFNLDFDAAHELASSWLAQHPDDLEALTYLMKSIFDKELMKEGLLTTSAYQDTGQAYHKTHAPPPAGFKKEIFDLIHRADAIADQRLASNPNDEEALYWGGVMHGTIAEYDFVMERAWVAAIREGARAHRLHEQLYKADPTFKDALVVIGMYNYVTGSLPWYLKVLAAIVGFRGSKSRGIEQLEEVTRSGYYTRDYAKVLLIALYRREKKFDQAFAGLPELQKKYPRDYQLWEEQARVEMDRGNWGEAARVEDTLVDWLRSRRAGWQAMNPVEILFDAAQVHEHLGELDQALALAEDATHVPGDDPLKYRAALTAGGLNERLNRPDFARRNYELVANAVPESDEGKAARRALKRLQ